MRLTYSDITFESMLSLDKVIFFIRLAENESM